MVKYPRLLSRLVSLFFAAGSGAAVVQTDSGPVSGSTSDGVAAYLAIPYAAPPLGGLRWKPPADPLPWSGVRDATRRGPQCPQPGEVPPNGMSEDCLTLNVWTPAATSTARLPVMVFIHGGSWM